MERVFMTSNNPDFLVGVTDSVDSFQAQQTNQIVDDTVISNQVISSPEPRAQMEAHSQYEPSSLAMPDEPISSSPNPAPSILINNYEEEDKIDLGQTAATMNEVDLQSEMNNSDHSGLTNSGADVKRSSDQEADVDTESEAAHHHSRLLRLLSNDLGGDGSSGGETGVRSSPTSPPSASETETSFMPLTLPGVRLRIRSLRAKDRIPSRVFRSLQHEFDSSTEDIVQAVISSPPPLSPAAGQLPSGTAGHSSFFRYSRLYASVTPETPSSATSELDGFFQSHLNPLHWLHENVDWQ